MPLLRVSPALRVSPGPVLFCPTLSSAADHCIETALALCCTCLVLLSTGLQCPVLPCLSPALHCLSPALPLPCLCPASALPCFCPASALPYLCPNLTQHTSGRSSLWFFARSCCPDAYFTSAHRDSNLQAWRLVWA